MLPPVHGARQCERVRAGDLPTLLDGHGRTHPTCEVRINAVLDNYLRSK